MAERSAQSSSESILSWKEELLNLLVNPPRENPGPKLVTWADVSYRLPIEPKRIPGRPKSCMKVTKTNFEYCSLRSQSKSLPSPWRDEVRNRWNTPADEEAAPESGMLSHLRDMSTKASKRVLKAFLKLMENKWERLAETGTFLVHSVTVQEPGRVAWPNTPMIQRHYTSTVERNMQEIFQQTIREADQLRETALLKPGNSSWKRCGIWLKEKVLGCPTPKRSCLKKTKAESVSGDEAGASQRPVEVRYFTSHQTEIPSQAELDTELKTVTFVTGCEIDLI